MKKKRWGKIFGLLLVMSVLTLLPMNVQAASKKGMALEAYRTWLARQSSSGQFALVYVDKDSVPELVYFKEWGNVENVYTYKNGSVASIYSSAWSGYGRGGYYEKTGIFTAGWAHTSTGSLAAIESTSYLKMSSSEIKEVLYKGKSISFTTSWKMKSTSHFYRANGKKISKSAFNAKLKKLVGNKKIKKFRNAKKHINSVENREKYLK